MRNSTRTMDPREKMIEEEGGKIEMEIAEEITNTVS